VLAGPAVLCPVRRARATLAGSAVLLRRVVLAGLAVLVRCVVLAGRAMLPGASFSPASAGRALAAQQPAHFRRNRA
jgi:hypothetical protein